jgi:hypothetical protein
MYFTAYFKFENVIQSRKNLTCQGISTWGPPDRLVRPMCEVMRYGQTNFIGGSSDSSSRVHANKNIIVIIV